MTVYQPIYYWPLDVFTAAGASVRQQILDALKVRLQTILVSNGYRTNLGQNVVEWDETPLDPDKETFRLKYKDEDENRLQDTVGEQDLFLDVSIMVETVEASPEVYIRKALADIVAAVYADPTFGGLADDAIDNGTYRMGKGEAADTATGMFVKYRINYVTARGSA